MTQVLFVSIAFPPKSDPECLQTAKCYKYLRSSKSLNIEVLTSSSPTLNMPVDEDLNAFLTGKDTIHEIDVPENRYLNFIRRSIAPSILEKPDSKNKFHEQWQSAITKIQIKPEIIYSRSYPLSSAIMGMKLKEYYKVPHIMHLSDGWTDNPYRKWSTKGKQFNEHLERNSFKSADLISVTSKKTAEFYQEKYPEFADKIKLHFNCFDPDDLKPSHVNWEGKLQLVYTGGLVGSRVPTPLFQALDELAVRNPEILKKLDIVFAGHLDSTTRKIFNLCSHKCVTHLGPVSYEHALTLQKKGHILLIIDSKLDNPMEAMLYPSKLPDYLMAQRQILAITDQQSSTHDAIVKHNLGTCFEHHQSLKLAEHIEQLVNDFELRKEEKFLMTNSVDELSAIKNAEKLENWIMTLTQK